MRNPLTKSQFQSPLVKCNAERKVGNPNAEGLEERQIVVRSTSGTTPYNTCKRPDRIPVSRLRSEEFDEFARKSLGLGNAIRNDLGGASDNIGGDFGAAGHDCAHRVDMRAAVHHVSGQDWL